jgi:hypothetical protein
MEVTLKLLPGRLERVFGKPESIVTYKGQGNDWYSIPTFAPASTKVARILKSIYHGWEYRHIQYQVKQQISKAS